MPKPLRYWSLQALWLLHSAIIISSVLGCSVLHLLHIPGMLLLNVTPDWLLIWVVVWSLGRSPIVGTAAGISLGWIQDGLTSGTPTHALGLGVVGFVLGSINQNRALDRDCLVGALFVFAASILVETVYALQLLIQGDWPWSLLWLHWQKVVLSSAIISSLWAPVLFVPLTYWWKRFALLLEQQRRRPRLLR